MINVLPWLGSYQLWNPEIISHLLWPSSRMYMWYWVETGRRSLDHSSEVEGCGNKEICAGHEDLPLEGSVDLEILNGNNYRPGLVQHVGRPRKPHVKLDVEDRQRSASHATGFVLECLEIVIGKQYRCASLIASSSSTLLPRAWLQKGRERRGIAMEQVRAEAHPINSACRLVRSGQNRIKVCIILYDASRKALASSEF